MKIGVLYVIAICAILVHQGAAQPRFGTDFQVWNDTQLILPLDEKREWNATLWIFGRFGDNVSRPTDARIGGLLTKRINKYVTVGGGYLYRYSNPTFTTGRYESRYLGLATFTAPLDKKWTLVNRNLVQYENRYSRPNSTVIRNRFWLKREVKVRGEKFEPFVSFEPFYDTALGEFARYRTQAGITRKFNDKFSADLFYVRQDETGGGSRPGTLNGLGTSFRINLK